ncbi:MAG TPA: V-type ATP synthase subunit K [Clostridiaceae bacterium]|jgi:V/A-type H+-transporting ATPase subunit K|nr:V-type ATP synthase subunit K [Clostridiaceae bacterium]
MSSIIGPLLVYFAAAVAVILPGYGSAKVVGKLGQAATGILAEDPSLFGRLLILQALPGTQGIYGLLGWFMIMNQSGMMAGNTNITVQQGILFLLAALPVAVIGLLSAFHQGKVAESGMALLTKQPQAGGNAIVLAVMVETYAILALLATVLGALSIAV